MTEYLHSYVVNRLMHMRPLVEVCKATHVMLLQYPSISLKIRNTPRADETIEYVDCSSILVLSLNLIGNRVGHTVDVRASGDLEETVLKECANIIGEIFTKAE